MLKKILIIWSDPAHCQRSVSMRGDSAQNSLFPKDNPRRALSAILFIGSIFFRPLLYAGILALILDAIFSIGITVQVTMVGPEFKQDFTFQKDP